MHAGASRLPRARGRGCGAYRSAKLPAAQRPAAKRSLTQWNCLKSLLAMAASANRLFGLGMGRQRMWHSSGSTTNPTSGVALPSPDDISKTLVPETTPHIQ